MTFVRKIVSVLFLSVFLQAALFGPFASANTVDELRAEIAERNRKIKELEEEIAQYENRIAETDEEKKTLQSAIRRLNLERSRLLTEIRVTENKIGSVTLTLDQLGSEIAEKEDEIHLSKQSISILLQEMNEADTRTSVERLLSNETFAQSLDRVESIRTIKASIVGNIEQLRNLKSELQSKRKKTDARRRELAVLKEDLSDQRKITDINRSEKSRLLRETRNKEEAYKQELEERERLKRKFQRELFEFESRLKFEIDPDSVPAPSEGLLQYPLDSVHITQYFGNTAFSRRNSSVYNGSGHNGVDFRASRGTKVKAALSGIVKGTGNTDLERGCYSYGKWVLIEHGNGLSTLYAHLDLIRAAAGEAVSTGETIGFSGNTGYSTGPHLHFGLYATQGVRIVRFGDVREKTNCPNAHIPVADLRAYLNPLEYI